MFDRENYDKINSAFSYNKEDGKLYWKESVDKPSWWNTRYANREAGSLSKGYIRVDLGGKPYFAHRLVWLLNYGSFPEGHLDHINGDRSDNRVENLRVVNQAENCMNRVNPLNTSGYQGVRKNGQGWQSIITYKGKQYCLGTFQTKVDAYAAYLLKAAEIGFSERHGRVYGK